MKLAIVRIRGNVRITERVRKTLRLLGLEKKNHCSLVEDDAHIQGMLRRITSFITWGPADDKTTTIVQKKDGRLCPPRKGYGRKGIKMPFKLGGAYGDRKEKINELIMRMS